MNILFPPELLVSSGFVFQTHQETSAFSDLLAEELIRRLDKTGKEVKDADDIKRLYNTDPEWREVFLKTANELLKEIDTYRSRIRGLVNMENCDLHTVSIQQLYLSKPCADLLKQEGVRSIGDIQDACNKLALHLPHEYLIEVLKCTKRIAPPFLN